MRNLIFSKKALQLTTLTVMALLQTCSLWAKSENTPSEIVLQDSIQSVSGVVTDENALPMIGVTVTIPGTTMGALTDAEGKYTIKIPKGKTQLSFSFIGYLTQIVSTGKSVYNIQLLPDITSLTEVVVIGYGTQTKKDLTGTITSLGRDDFNSGPVSSPEQLINGKVAGVQIVSNSGSPTAGSTIRIRGGASLNASNDPLVVLDGVPLETGGISGNSNNFLSLINPSDIENITILKDASSTAIYGSRASNGVILITTKKGSDKLKINITTTQSVQHHLAMADMLSAGEFKQIINEKGTPEQIALLGDQNTDWGKEIFQLALGSDNNVSVSGKVKDVIPFRVSAGYYKQNGILKTDKAERYTGNLSISPSLFNSHVKLNFNVKGTYNKNQFAYTDAIYAASAYNPTIGATSGNNRFGGYNEAINNNGTPTIAGQVFNPFGLIEQYESKSQVSRLIGNFDVDYKVHFLPELRVHLTLGGDYAKGQGSIFVSDSAASYYASGGRDYEYGPEENTNKLFTSYLNYATNLKSINSRIDITAGYDYQKWNSEKDVYNELNLTQESQAVSAATDERHVLLSYYGRVNYTLNSKYLLTATVRQDGSSRFSEDNRWSLFPSLALAWHISDEVFLKDIKPLSNLKFRLSYGETGQQDGIGNYSYIPNYTISQNGAQYLLGNPYYNTYRAEAYLSNLKWEHTESHNIGLDFGFFNNRISGSIDYYKRNTNDLLAKVPTPAGTNFDKTVTTNVGNMKSNGFEFSLNLSPVQTEDWTWDVSYNFTWQEVEITNLSISKGSESSFAYVGQAFDDTYLQIMRAGYAPYTFYTYKQVYDEKGKPIEGLYADISGDGKINSNDLYYGKSPEPDFLMALSSQVRYKDWSLGLAFRASIGNYAYNGTAMNNGALGTISYNPYQINNLSSSYLDTGFESRQFLSDYYIEDASFVKMDNINLGYNFGEIITGINLQLNAMVHNLFTITNYSGVDPEISGGIESSFYPRARAYSISIGVDF